MSLIIDEKINKQEKKKSLVKQMGILLVVSFVGIFIMLIFLFILIRNMSGSPYTMPLNEISSPDMISHWGLNRSPFQQFFIFLWNTISGNWGESYIIRTGTPVKEMIVVVFPRFLELNFLSLIFSLPLGVIFGILTFRFRDSWKGLIPKAIKRLNWAIYIAGLGMFLVYTVGYKLRWLPGCLYFDPILPNIPTITHFRLLDCLIAGNFVAFWDTIAHMIMPLFCLSFIMISFITEMTYSIIDFYKTPNEIHYLSGKIGFYLSFIFNSNMILELSFCTNGLAMFTAQSINSGDVFAMSAAIYCILLTFMIISLSINILLRIIPGIMEWVKKSKMDNIETDSNILSEFPISKSISDSPETVSEPNIEENSLALDSDKNRNSIPKEFFRNLKSKLKNPLTILGIFIVLIILILAIFTIWIAPYDYGTITGTEFTAYDYSPPSAEHIFGVAKFGRDVFSRCLYGIKTAVKVGLFSTLIGMPLGVLMGTVSAFYGKWVKYVIDTINGMILIVPGIIFAFSIISIIGNDIRNFYWILGLISFPIATLFTQQAVSYEMKKGAIIPREFSKSNGRKIRNRLPNIILSILGVGCLVMGLSILIFEILSFTGLGDYSIIGLGTDVNIGRSRLTTAPWASFWPAFWIFIVVLGFIMLGSGLKEEE
jgi:peptide/nickel transport system permease protein